MVAGEVEACQRAINAKGVSDRSDALGGVGAAAPTGHTAQLVIGEVEACQLAISSQRWSERCGTNRSKTIPTQTAQQTRACNCPSASKAKARQEAVTNQVWILVELTQFSSASH